MTIHVYIVKSEQMLGSSITAHNILCHWNWQNKCKHTKIWKQSIVIKRQTI